MIAKSHDTFISYAREDGQTARRLATALTRLGWSVWIDDRLEVGKPFDRGIRDVLATVRSVIVLWSGHSVSSKWVLEEAKVARRRDVLVPVLLDIVKLPAEFAELHAAHLRDWNGSEDAAFGRLCLALGNRLGCPGDAAARLIERARREVDEHRQGASRWVDLAAPIERPDEISWPYWMVRYVVADTEEALSDLIWSVGGAPPYGDVDYSEAEAVYQLIEQFRGPGRASESAYALVERFLTARPEAARALEAFRIYDRVASRSESYTDADLRIGSVDAIDAVDEPLSAYFDLLRAGLRHGTGALAEAYALSRRAVESLSRFAEIQTVYRTRLIQALTNNASFAVLNGDFAEARRSAEQLGALGADHMLQGLREPLLVSPPPTGAFEDLSRAGGDHLEEGRAFHALEALLAAERAALAERRDRELAGLLGDIAVAYRRVGNLEKAVATYRRAVEISQRMGDMLNLTRWCQNLAGILSREGNHDAALPYARTGLYAATRLGDPMQISLAANTLAAAVPPGAEAATIMANVVEAAAVLLEDAAATGEEHTAAVKLISELKTSLKQQAKPRRARKR